ncbi:MAG: hypothetical protein IKS41_06630 [Alphaproteobacteria bacterium]|nr:hypothetical protein [Alphaproteobacteria bacterium]
MDDLELTEWDDFEGDFLLSDDDIGEGAYIKREVVHFRPVYRVYDTEGQLLAEASSRYEAFLMIRRNDLTPYDVH